MSRKKQTSLLILGLFITLGMVVGVSYAVWQITLEQSGSNIITSDCFKIEFSDLNPINLEKAYPITNAEGEALTPYEFTITNTCNTRANYQINLEILNDTTFTRLEYIREKLNEKGVSSGSRILTRNSTVEKTLENAKEAYKLNQGMLEASESKTYEFRLWMDESTPAIEEVMNKTLNTKITVVTSLKRPVDTSNMMVAMDLEEKCLGNEEKQYCYPDKNNTYTQGEKYKGTLKKVIFESVKSPMENALEMKDFSVSQDESVLGYYVGNEDNTEVTLHIQADGKIKVNENGSFYFSTLNDTPSYIFEGFENLDTSEVTDMSYMFRDMSSVTSLDVSHFDTRNVTNMSSMFEGMDQLTSLDVSHFDTSNVTNMSNMFAFMRSLTSLDVSHFDTSKVTDMSGMFDVMSNANSLDLSSFDTSNVTAMNNMFYGMNSLMNLDLSSFDTSNVTDMELMFAGMNSLTSLNLSSFDTSNVTNMNSMFHGMNSLINLDVSSFDTRNVRDMSRMFADLSNITNLNVSNFNTAKVVSMAEMFAAMSSLTSLDLSSFDTSNVLNMSQMFAGMEQLTSLDISNFNTTKVVSMDEMFVAMSSLTTLDLSSFDTSNVTDMSRMFAGMGSLMSLDISNFNTTKVVSMAEMFAAMSSLTSLDLSSFDTSNTDTFVGMFMETSSLTTIVYNDKFIKKDGAVTEAMFRNCLANKPTHSSWNDVTWD